MPYLIDGHNLIPKIPGMSLRQMDDEQQLIVLLQEFCRAQRKQVEVFFDQAPVGQLAVRRYGAVTAHFVRTGQTADAAIRARLERLGPDARNWVVVSSDLVVQGSARAARTHFVPSETFAREMAQASKGKKAPEKGQEDRLSEEELDEWMSLFGKKKA